ncbi:hypothetical protein D3C74_373090 [compost metagenome]
MRTSSPGSAWLPSTARSPLMVTLPPSTSLSASRREQNPVSLMNLLILTSIFTPFFVHSLPGSMLSGFGQFNGNLSTAPVFTVYFQAPLVGLDNPLADHQPKARSRLLVGKERLP